MDLKTLLNEIARTAIEQKCINYSAAGADIYQLNVKKIDGYPVLFISPTGNHSVSQNSTSFQLTLYYFDRLAEDDVNDTDILSAAVEQLKNIVRHIIDIEGVIYVSETYSITNFIETQAFNDRIAGAYTTINVEVVNNTICAVD